MTIDVLWLYSTYNYYDMLGYEFSIVSYLKNELNSLMLLGGLMWRIDWILI